MNALLFDPTKPLPPAIVKMQAGSGFYTLTLQNGEVVVARAGQCLVMGLDAHVVVMNAAAYNALPAYSFGGQQRDNTALHEEVATLLLPRLQAVETQAAAAAPAATVQAALQQKASAATVSTLVATVTQHTTDLAGKLNKAGDTATGSILVPAATAAAAAPRLDQTYGGLNSPIRFASGITAAATTAQQAMLPGPLTDPTPQGRRAKPMQVFLTMRVAPTVGCTVRVGTTPGGAEVFTRSFLLTALPGLNVLLDPGTAKFAELPAGTTLYASCTGGTWDVEVFSYYKA